MNIPINQVKVGTRIRKDLTGIKELAEDIEQVGLIHPISIDIDAICEKYLIPEK